MDSCPLKGAEADGEVPKRFVSKKELCAVTGLSPASVERYRRAGKIPYWQPGGPGARVLYLLDAITTVTAACAAPVSPPTTISANSSRKRFGRRPSWECSTQP